ncbi:hypothetical protein LPB136_02905 [Tenacibaculum todarodis]|uniref:Uncharacterized protein n=1 Tax=Tenacibaculum todarodis TaxID=1850252 RepID=A0A1L3JGY6_9FLAO|nr:hypothetical protein [Tenacibaculum todarodis]APG64379.1 hypothetical protein LPB136_02905 [Tenacibaculum todarodis]
MGLLSYLKKQVIGKEGIEVLNRFPKWSKEINEHSYKKVKLVTENRKLDIEGQYLRKFINENNLLPFLDEKYIHTGANGYKSLIWYGPGLPTERFYSVNSVFLTFEKLELTNKQKNILNKFGALNPNEFKTGVYVNRKELSEIITEFGGIKKKNLDEFELIGLFGSSFLKDLIRQYNETEIISDDSFNSEDEEIQESYSNGIRYISIWSFKRINGISPNSNEDNYINSEDIFDKYPSLETIKIKIENNKFEYVLGYPEKILTAFFNV